MRYLLEKQHLRRRRLLGYWRNDYLWRMYGGEKENRRIEKEIKEMEETHKNCEVVYINGAIGGMISAKEIKKVYRNTIDCEEYTKEFGKNLGKLTINLKDDEEIQPIVNIKSKQINVPLKSVSASPFTDSTRSSIK